MALSTLVPKCSEARTESLIRATGSGRAGRCRRCEGEQEHEGTHSGHREWVPLGGGRAKGRRKCSLSTNTDRTGGAWCSAPCLNPL